MSLSFSVRKAVYRERDDKAQWQRAYLDVIVPVFSRRHFNRSHTNKPKPSTNLTKYSTFFLVKFN